MTDNQFCEIESSYSGEHIDKVAQLQKATFTGAELKEYIEFAIKHLNRNKRTIKVKTLWLNRFNVNLYKGAYNKRLTILIFKRAVIITF